MAVPMTRLSILLAGILLGLSCTAAAAAAPGTAAAAFAATQTAPTTQQLHKTQRLLVLSTITPLLQPIPPPAASHDNAGSISSRNEVCFTLRGQLSPLKASDAEGTTSNSTSAPGLAPVVHRSCLEPSAATAAPAAVQLHAALLLTPPAADTLAATATDKPSTGPPAEACRVADAPACSSSSSAEGGTSAPIASPVLLLLTAHCEQVVAGHSVHLWTDSRMIQPGTAAISLSIDMRHADTWMLGSSDLVAPQQPPSQVSSVVCPLSSSLARPAPSPGKTGLQEQMAAAAAGDPAGFAYSLAGLLDNQAAQARWLRLHMAESSPGSSATHTECAAWPLAAGAAAGGSVALQGLLPASNPPWTAKQCPATAVADAGPKHTVLGRQEPASNTTSGAGSSNSTGAPAGSFPEAACASLAGISACLVPLGPVATRRQRPHRAVVLRAAPVHFSLALAAVVLVAAAAGAVACRRRQPPGCEHLPLLQQQQGAGSGDAALHIQGRELLQHLDWDDEPPAVGGDGQGVLLTDQQPAQTAAAAGSDPFGYSQTLLSSATAASPPGVVRRASAAAAGRAAGALKAAFERSAAAAAATSAAAGAGGGAEGGSHQMLPDGQQHGAGAQPAAASGAFWYYEGDEEAVNRLPANIQDSLAAAGGRWARDGGGRLVRGSLQAVRRAAAALDTAAAAMGGGAGARDRAQQLDGVREADGDAGVLQQLIAAAPGTVLAEW